MASAILRVALAGTIVAAMTAAGVAQPQTKLVSQLDKQTIQAIWCSALLFERSFFYEEESADSLRYEDLAFELGAEIDTILLEDRNMRQSEVDEIWSVFDDEAFALNAENQSDYLEQLANCENGYDGLL